MVVRLLLLCLIASCAGLELPDVEFGGRDVPAAAQQIELREGGTILVDGAPTSLGALEPADGPIVVHVDRRAPAIHAVWLLTELPRDRTWIAARERGRLVVLPGPAEPEWDRPSLWVGVDEDGRFTFPFVEGDVGALGYLRTETTTDAGRLRGWIAEWRSHLATKPDGEIHARSDLPFERLATVAAAFSAAGARGVDWGFEQATPWVLAQPTLPPPTHPRETGGWAWAAVKDAPYLTLPPASEGVLDRGDDPDDRVIVTLNGRGEILWRGTPRSLDELASILDRCKRLYELKQRATGGAADRSLYVLLRADRDAPWQHVRWILAILREQGLDKLQLAVMRTADVRYTAEEALRLGARREDRFPAPTGHLDDKLENFLAKPDAVARLIGIRATRTAERPWGEHRVDAPVAVAYRLGERETENVRELEEWLRAEDGLFRIDADPAVPWKFVVAAVNRCHAVGHAPVELPAAVPTDRQRLVPALAHPARPGLYAVDPGPAEDVELPDDRG